MALRKLIIEEPLKPRERVDPVAFKKRLVRALTVAGFTQSDLAVWLDRTKETVRSWLYDNKRPRMNFRTDDARARLDLLDRLLKANFPGLPVPPSLSQRVRADHVRRIYKDACRAIARGDIRTDGGMQNRRRARSNRKVGGSGG